jgi:hypothetical protein
MATRTDCLQALQAAAATLDASPTKQAYEELGRTPSASTILRHFDGWNAAKRAAGLDTNPSTGSRVAPKPDDVDIPDDTAWADLSADQRWHYRHVDANTARTRDRRAHLRAAVYEYKRDYCACARCGEGDPACLEFHHRDPDEKERAIGEMVTYGYALPKIRAEIEKCDVLCANCHRTQHYDVPEAVTPPGETLDSPFESD